MSVRIALCMGLLLLHAVSGNPSCALSLGVAGIPWDTAVDSSAFVQIDSDSIWTWSAPVDRNIADRAVQRGEALI